MEQRGSRRISAIPFRASPLTIHKHSTKIHLPYRNSFSVNITKIQCWQRIGGEHEKTAENGDIVRSREQFQIVPGIKVATLRLDLQSNTQLAC